MLSKSIPSKLSCQTGSKPLGFQVVNFVETGNVTQSLNHVINDEPLYELTIQEFAGKDDALFKVIIHFLLVMNYQLMIHLNDVKPS